MCGQPHHVKPKDIIIIYFVVGTDVRRPNDAVNPIHSLHLLRSFLKVKGTLLSRMSDDSEWASYYIDLATHIDIDCSLIALLSASKLSTQLIHPWLLHCLMCATGVVSH